MKSHKASLYSSQSALLLSRENLKCSRWFLETVKIALEIRFDAPPLLSFISHQITRETSTLMYLWKHLKKVPRPPTAFFFA